MKSASIRDVAISVIIGGLSAIVTVEAKADSTDLKYCKSLGASSCQVLDIGSISYALNVLVEGLGTTQLVKLNYCRNGQLRQKFYQPINPANGAAVTSSSNDLLASVPGESAFATPISMATACSDPLITPAQ